MTAERTVTPRWQVVYVAATCAVIGWCLAYVLCDALGWPRIAYLPYANTFAVPSGKPAPSTMMYWGTVLWGVVGGAIGAAAGGTIARALRRPLPERAFSLLGAWALTMFAIAGLYYLWNLWPF